jgi:hypothetical protein
MDNQRMLELCKSLDGMSALEWKKLRYIIDTHFHNKTRELEPQLKLSTNDVEKTIHLQFG